MIDLDALEMGWDDDDHISFGMVRPLVAELRASRKVVEAASDVASECDHSEDARGFCVGHGGITRLPCEFATLSAALAELDALK